MDKKIKLIMFDIDGTLVDNDKNISQLTIQVLRCLHQHGIPLGLASGRTSENLLLRSKEWELGFDFDYLIGLNGVEIYDVKQKVKHKQYELSPEVLKEIIELLVSYNQYPFLTYDTTYKHHYQDPVVQRHQSNKNYDLVLVQDFSELWKEKMAKVLCVINDQNEMEEVINKVNQHPSPLYHCYKTQPDFLEFSDPRINKGIALKKLCSLYDMDIQETMALGDMENDLEMIECAGVGVCMKNGTEDVKRVADYVTDLDNDHDGLAHFLIENYLVPMGLWSEE